MDSASRLPLGFGIALVFGLACASRPAEPVDDFSEEVEQICADYTCKAEKENVTSLTCDEDPREGA